VAAACRDAVDSYAWLLREDGDGRPIGMLRAEVLADLILRPWDTGRPAVTAQVGIWAPLSALGGTFTAPGQPAPTGQVDGQPITAAHLKELLAQMDVLGVQPPPGGTLQLSITDATGKLAGTLTRRELEQLARRGCTQHADQPCDCPLLGKPDPVDRYRPSPAQRRFLTTRDRSCRHPGCRNRAGWADLDHVLPYDHGGPTDCDNLCCLCRRHHRLKTHAAGWRFHLDPDGTLTVTTPSGVTRVTRPPGLDPPEPGATGGPSTPHTVGGADSTLPADDPPPFSYGDPPF
jgi:hypothetical protein